MRARTLGGMVALTSWEEARNDPVLWRMPDRHAAARERRGGARLRALFRRRGLQHGDRARAAGGAGGVLRRPLDGPLRPDPRGRAPQEPGRRAPLGPQRPADDAGLRHAHRRARAIRLLRREHRRADADRGRPAGSRPRGDRALLRRHLAGVRARGRHLCRARRAGGGEAPDHGRSERAPRLHPRRGALPRAADRHAGRRRHREGLGRGHGLARTSPPKA